MAWLVDGRGSRDSVEPVIPLCEQLRAQHKRAVETSGVRLSAWAAFLQQSIPAIPGMMHSCSLECSGMPAKTPPPITRTSASDAKRLAMLNQSMEAIRPCQDTNGAFRLVTGWCMRPTTSRFSVISQLPWHLLSYAL